MLFSPNNGNIEVISFLDINQNGIKDKGEPALSNIALNISGAQSDSITNKKGVYIASNLPEGFYKVKIDMDKLPGLLSLSAASKEEYLVKVDKDKTTKVYFGITSSVGNITGTVKIHDDFNRNVKINDLVIGAYDDKNNEIKYATVNDDGSYYISGLAPGKYTLKIDDEFINAYNLVYSGDNKIRNINIPPVYDNFVDIKDLNLEYIQSSTERL